MTQSKAVDGPTLPLSIQLGWGIGTFAPALVLSATNVLLLRFMTDHVGIAAATAGLLIAASKLYDAVTDPITGVLSDRTRSKIGRRRPFLVIGGILLALSLVALFAPPQFENVLWSTVWMGVMLLVYATAYSLFAIPYMAMPAEMTQNYHERSVLMTWRVYAVAGAGLAANALGPLLIARGGGGADGHLLMALSLAPLVAIAAIICFLATKNAPFTEKATNAPRYSIAEQVRLIFANKPFTVLLFIKLFTLMMLGVQAAFPFFFRQILQVSDAQLGLYFACSTGGMLVSQPIWLWIVKRLGKKHTYMIALSLVIAIALSWLLANQGDPTWQILTRGVLLGFASGGALLMGQALLPDTMEYDYRRTGLRREGLFSALYTTVEKLASALGVAAVGAFLGAMGYVASRGGIAEQPDSAILAIQICVAVFPAVVNGASFIALLFYDLSETKLKALRDAPAPAAA
jgi:GPH family glycoside/pentoside/hexuronide:cation symporter